MSASHGLQLELRSATQHGSMHGGPTPIAPPELAAAAAKVVGRLRVHGLAATAQAVSACVVRIHVSLKWYLPDLGHAACDGRGWLTLDAQGIHPDELCSRLSDTLRRDILDVARGLRFPPPFEGIREQDRHRFTRG